ncbi:MAG: hypothetical protein SOW59_03445 [Corynebacterium sp.]|nr:hypothetical protein [Corynebacterium sp.]
MSDFYIDYEPAQRQLRDAIVNAEEHLRAHESQAPAFPPHSTGNGFAGHGAQISNLLNNMHERTRWRLHNALNTFQAAVQQQEQFKLADVSNAHSFSTKWEQ